MRSLPKSEDLTSLVVRTDFGDDVRWEAFIAALRSTDEYPVATFVSDPAYAGVTIQQLVDADAAAEPDDREFYLFVADATTLADDEFPLLAVDLDTEPGRSFRVPVRFYGDVSANLSIANLDFADFADAVDATGTYRGSD
ncbi:hypothetical protein BJY16_005686 [Actinoplanes octamycinicus]|uniref:DUF6924 domain-containing protein n=1 Tax=Actinoplanes octamycinicus TaxID=135948 RepID=A0A7W7H1M2_9ACTN|nr:hypothetical protein [Actinoplanes octamycinicus]MBB4742227.1 hypothetical protein [Actinoplanes octamycinicus]GIE59928.1 hypothetical protein Aoc01nite_53300 [Actinoplanes octamycinicus]